MNKNFFRVRPLIQAIKGDFKRQLLRIGLFVFCVLLLVAIECWDHFAPLPAHDWMATNLKKIKVNQQNEISFAVFGDNKNSFTTFEELLKHIDQDHDIAFALDLGDLVYDGEKEKYRYFFNQLRRNLHLPILTAIGNHELKENGRGLYYDIFGPFYYSFQIGNNYFIVLDDANEIGLDFWQSRWLEEELIKSQHFSTRFIFMHVPLFDPRGGMYKHCLPEREAHKLAVLFQKYRVTHIFASHIHGYFNGQWQGVPYTITGGAGAELYGIDPSHFFYHYLKVKVKDGTAQIQVHRLPSPDYEWLDRLGFIAWLYIYAFIRIHGIEMALFLIAAGLLMLTLRSRKT
ncbi:MAG: metallophosphoesterase [Deltaproteobacteria bacterium]|nr:metallophosphoesterase [Deltaproteobacteria bacterium]